MDEEKIIDTASQEPDVEVTIDASDNEEEAVVDSVEETAVEEAIVEDTTNTKKKNSIGREIFEWFYTIVIAFAIAFLIKGFLFDIVRVDGESMLPTLINNDRLIVTRLGYDPSQGDIVILDSNYVPRTQHYSEMESEPNVFVKAKTKLFDPQYKTIWYVKRVIALPGQTVDVHDGKVYVDGKVYEDGFHQGDTSTMGASISYPHKVADGCVFVMGDNREHSKDSRMIGDIPYEAIMGKAQLRIFPFNTIGGLYSK